MKFIEELATKRRFGMKPGLAAITKAMSQLGNPEQRLNVVHIAGTNGKGATAAILDAALRAEGKTTGRYTSPHLVKLNERFFYKGEPIDDDTLENAAKTVETKVDTTALTFFEALTAVCFELYKQLNPNWLILETGLGGRLDATNIAQSKLAIITRIGLDHCDWLGNTLEAIATEKAGIIKRGVPIILGANEPIVIEVIKAKAQELGAPFYYAPELINCLTEDLSLKGEFNRENYVTALAALKVLGINNPKGLDKVVWPGRFQKVGQFIIDGAHNPPGADALVQSLLIEGYKNLTLIAGFCGDKAVTSVLKILAPVVSKAYAVKTNNPRSLSSEELVKLMAEVGIKAEAVPNLDVALKLIPPCSDNKVTTLIAGSLFLAGEAIVKLGVYPWGKKRFDPSESLKNLI